MKRTVEEEETCDNDDTNLFLLEEGIDIFLTAVQSTVLLAQFLCLSKKIRRRVWNFLIAPDRATIAWLGEFSKDMWIRRPPGGNTPSYGVRAMYPLFVSTGGSYMLARFMESNVVLVATTYSHSKEPPVVRYPGWQVYAVADIDKSLNWYFVARALILGWETRICRFNFHCWHTETPFSDDAHLCRL